MMYMVTSYSYIAFHAADYTAFWFVIVLSAYYVFCLVVWENFRMFFAP
jgi:hypothetical protein